MAAFRQWAFASLMDLLSPLRLFRNFYPSIPFVRSCRPFSIVWIANIYMSLFGRLRLAITSERQDIAVGEQLVKAEEDLVTKV